MSQLMEAHKARFGTAKPVIGCLHMMALPGTPYYDGSTTVADQIARLKREARLYSDLGYDAVVFANEGDRPYLTTVGPEVIAAYVRIATEVLPELSIPWGCGVLIDPFATMAVAQALDARFVRTYVSGSFEGSFGSQAFCPGEIFRYRSSIGAQDIAVYTYFEPHAATSLDTRSSEAMLEAGVMNMPIAGALFGGAHAGLPPQEGHIAQLKQAFPEVPLMIGSGGTVDNISDLLQFGDGVIVGTALKEDGILWNPVDPVRAEAFIRAAKS